MHINISPSAPIDAKYLLRQANGVLTDESDLSALATGLLKNTTGTGAPSIGVKGTDYPGLDFANVFTANQTIPDGTEAAPGLALTSSASTGMFYTVVSGGDGLGFTAAGVVRMRASIRGIDMVANAGTSTGFYFLDDGLVTQWFQRINSNDANALSFDGSAGGLQGSLRLQLNGAHSMNGTYQINFTDTETGITNVLTVNHKNDAGTVANFGTGLRFLGTSSDEHDRNMARLVTIWDVATDAIRSAALQVLISNNAGEVNAAKFDDDATAGNTRLLVYDVDNATLERVSVGAADSGGSGFKLLRIVN